VGRGEQVDGRGAQSGVREVAGGTVLGSDATDEDVVRPAVEVAVAKRADLAGCRCIAGPVDARHGPVRIVAVAIATAPARRCVHGVPAPLARACVGGSAAQGAGFVVCLDAHAAAPPRDSGALITVTLLLLVAQSPPGARLAALSLAALATVTQSPAAVALAVLVTVTLDAQSPPPSILLAGLLAVIHAAGAAPRAAEHVIRQVSHAAASYTRQGVARLGVRLDVRPVAHAARTCAHPHQVVQRHGVRLLSELPDIRQR